MSDACVCLPPTSHLCSPSATRGPEPIASFGATAPLQRKPDSKALPFEAPAQGAAPAAGEESTEQ